ncbi:MAG: response regulator [Gemmatimonadaceae bacterium]|nr:response regulator [Gemmatimonadaceae bacterium]
MQSSPTDALPILVVDDDDHMLRTIGDILRFRGYAPIAVPSGRAGLAAAEQMSSPPAIALVDLRLPDMDGIELVSRLRALSELTEVVILTGNASLDSAVRALREQSYDYLVKPVQPDFLLRSIDRAAERWRRKSAEVAAQESRERLRRMFDHVRDALVITDATGHILDANPAAAALAGVPIEGLRERTIAGMLGTELGPLAEGAGTRVEYEMRSPGGAARVVEVQTDTFAPGMYVHTVRDLTERRRLEEELHQSRKMDAIGRLAGGVAHDINNVLTAILCYSELLINDLKETDHRRADVSEIRQAARRAAALTGQLLAFSRKQVLQPRVLDLNAVVDEMERMLARVIGEDITLLRQSAPDLWPVRADPGQLSQVLMNLAVNARDAMPGGGRLTIETANTSLAQLRLHRHGVIEPGDYVLLRVTDSGAGIPDDVLANIFEPFFTTKERGKGTGLGLSTVYGIIAQSNGRIEVASSVGVGTTFTIYLPRAKGEELPPEPRRSTSTTAAEPGHETILLVEDEDMLRTLLVRILTQQGYRVLAASDATETLTLARNHLAEVELLVIDIVMPGMSGRELADRLVEMRPDIKVLYMTGYTDDALVQYGVSDLRRSILQKPFSNQTLTRKIREILDGTE